MMQVWILTIWLIGNPVPVVDSDPFPSAGDCNKEGARQVRWYQQDHIQARWECEPKTKDPNEKEPA